MRPPRPRPLAFALLGAVLLAGALGACSDDDDDVGSSSPAREGRTGRTTSTTTVGTGPAGSDGTTTSTGPVALAGEEVKVSMKAYSFFPRQVEIASGATVTWQNLDPADHTVVDEAGQFAEPPPIRTGSRFSHVYAAPGTYAFRCGIHPNMRGTVVVT